MTARYNNYGLTRQEFKKLCDFCQDKDFKLQDMLLESAKESNKEIAEIIFESIVGNLSYERLSGRYYIPYDKGSFYGYRRMCLAIFKTKMDGIEINTKILSDSLNVKEWRRMTTPTEKQIEYARYLSQRMCQDLPKDFTRQAYSDFISKWQPAVMAEDAEMNEPDAWQMQYM